MEALTGTASSSILPVRHPPSRLAPQSLAFRPSRCGPLRAAAAGGGGGKDEAQPAPVANGSPVLKVRVAASLRMVASPVGLAWVKWFWRIARA